LSFQMLDNLSQGKDAETHESNKSEV
jgi:hypothetical protein